MAKRDSGYPNAIEPMSNKKAMNANKGRGPGSVKGSYQAKAGSPQRPMIGFASTQHDNAHAPQDEGRMC